MSFRSRVRASHGKYIQRVQILTFFRKLRKHEICSRGKFLSCFNSANIYMVIIVPKITPKNVRPDFKVQFLQLLKITLQIRAVLRCDNYTPPARSDASAPFCKQN